mmetsp:Transcript_19513/g.49551  ORF Transcript_19513/g.49551 Transcript_19513/m.49551 type:complete len:85 (-) Transcript_19513:15-269(-)
MSGIGYAHPTVGHGAQPGHALVVRTDRIDTELVDQMDPMYMHVQGICSVVAEGPAGRQEGVGALEQLVLGPHDPSGFKKLFDAA